MKSKESILASFFIVIILLVCFGWYRAENARLKQIEDLNNKIAEYEDTIEELTKDKEDLMEILRDNNIDY